MNTLSLLQRSKNLFDKDFDAHKDEIYYLLNGAKILVIGGAGSIGKATVKQIFKRNPKILDIVDISENNLVELVRDIRSSTGHNQCELKTYAIDAGSSEFKFFFQNNTYDYIFNLSALKHVRSEKDPFTLMRMLEVNIFNVVAT